MIQALTQLLTIWILSTGFGFSMAEEYCDLTVGYSKGHNVSSLKIELEFDLDGFVATPYDEQYEQLRAIHNPACCQRPLLIVRPANSQVPTPPTFCLSKSVQTPGL